jgi:hypothetical protein
MKKGRFNEEQIIGILKQHEAGRKVADLAREHGVGDATIYTWKGKYGGMLTIADTFIRECLGSRRVTRSLDRIIEQRGMPSSIRCDNGPELTSRHILGWSADNMIDLVHI